MHHFIYPTQDTFITDTVGYEDLNFGLDEILRVGTKVTEVKVTYPTTTYTYPPTVVANFCVENFSGSINTGSIWGSASFISGTVFNDNDDPVNFTVDYFSGSITGMVVGWETGSYLSSSNYSGSLLGFSGTIIIRSSSMPTWEELIDEYQNWEEVWNWAAYSGSLMGFVSGTFSSSYFGIFNGHVAGFTGKIIAGTISGSQTRPVQRQFITSSFFYNRALVQFDVSAISASVANGDIVNPKFTLKMDSAREENLPINYTLYVYPLSQSWVMGNGYVSDAGSEQGASWEYRDYSGGTRWAASGSSYLTSPAASQSFNYEVGDINLDITNIVMSWISGSIQNNGLVVLSSDEYGASQTGMSIYFFSRDTNTIYSPRLDVGWPDFEWTTGSISTASVATITSSAAGLYGTVVHTASMSGSIFGGFSGVGNVTITFDGSSSYTWEEINWDYTAWEEAWETQSGSAWGFIDVNGESGLINGLHIFGGFSGSISMSLWQTFKQCRACQPNFNEWWPIQYPDYVNVGVTDTSGPGWSSGPCSCGSSEPWWLAAPPPWWWSANGQCCHNSGSSTGGHTGGYQWVNKITSPITSGGPCDSGSYTGSWVTMSFLMGRLTTGDFSGCAFTASFINGYLLKYGILTGTWNSSMLYGTVITSSYPLLPLYPSAVYAYFSGLYLSGMALGSIVDSATSGTFDGTFVTGPYAGNKIYAPYTGSILTASIEMTVVTLKSSSLSPVAFDRPFATVIQNIPSVVKAGNVIRVNVFARPEFPLKNFNRQTQLEQHLIPQYLPTSSYYAIKDNETEEIILDFDNYTQISCDANGNYFMLDTTGLPQERYFRLLIKTEQGGSIYTFDKDNIFKIVR